MAVLRRWRRAVVLAAVLDGAVSWAIPAQGAPPQAGEDAIKAAFLYNFTKFIEWPEGAFTVSTSFNVCVFADGGFRQQLRNTLSGEHVRARPIRIQEFHDGEDLDGCHLLYFGPQHLDRSAARLAALKLMPVLTVGEGPRFLEQGGQIAFHLENNRVRFDISKVRAELAGLVVSSKLLRVARAIVGGPAP
jgi:hypothetical protein